MNRLQILINKNYTGGIIDPRLFGSFVEHMGRVVYTGIYEKGHPQADENGFRTDVIGKTKEMGVTTVRYPGGNFVSRYNWMDGIGPVDKRPKKRDLAWKSIETNEIGTDEFMKWSRTAGVETVMAVNLGTRGLEEALALLEYCNSEPGSYYSDLRKEYASEKPYGIRTWCLGNEMDGDWQIGHKTADEYGRLALETGKAMKLLDPSVELVVCGSSMSRNATFGEWDRSVIHHTFPIADYLSLHQYYGNQEKGSAYFLAQSLDLERFIQTACNICDVEGSMRKSRKKIQIALDEWGVWSVTDKAVQASVEANPWQIAPPFGEQIYSMEDTLLFASMYLAILRRSDRVKIACQSLLTNVSACIMTEPGGGVWVQPNYYVFSMIANHAKGAILETRSSGSTYYVEQFGEVPCVDQLALYSEADRELVFYFVNRTDREAEISVDCESFGEMELIENRQLSSEDRHNTNLENHGLIRPEQADDVMVKDRQILGTISPYTFKMVRIHTEK